MKFYFLCLCGYLCLFTSQRILGQTQVKSKDMHLTMPRNPKTNLISIVDSIHFPVSNAKESKDVIQEWEKFIMNPTNVKELYKSNKKTEFFQISLAGVTDSYAKNSYNSPYMMVYIPTQEDQMVNAIIRPNKSYPPLKYNFKYNINKDGITYEFTNFILDDTKFENDQFKPSGGNMLSEFSKNKKLWNEYRIEHLQRMVMLSEHFKKYILNYNVSVNSNSVNDFTNPKVSYNNYKIIQAGMNYDAVIKLLGDEGRELSNNKIKKDNKEVTEQIIVWFASEDNKEKFIKLVLIDKSVTSKSQANL